MFSGAFGGFEDGFASKFAATEASKINMLRRGSVSAECMNPPDAEDHSEKVVIAKSPEARERIQKAISNNLLFRNLDDAQKSEIVSKFTAYSKVVNDSFFRLTPCLKSL